MPYQSLLGLEGAHVGRRLVDSSGISVFATTSRSTKISIPAKILWKNSATFAFSATDNWYSDTEYLR